MSSDVRTRARAVFLAAIMLLSVVAMSGAFVGGAAAQSTVTVDDDGSSDYDTIQNAIDNVGSGSTIEVKQGTYSGFTVTKALTIKGPNDGTAGDKSGQRGAEATITGKVNIGDQSDTTLSGEVVIDGVEIATTDSGVTDGVVSVGDRQQKIENATIKNSVIDIDLSKSGVGVGIYSEEVDNLKIENNAFTESGSGVSVAYNAAESPVNTIEMSGNTLTNVDRLYNEGAGFIPGRGISSTTVRIVDNDVTGAGTAIGIGDSADTLTTVDYIIRRNQIDASSVGILQNGGTPASFTIENNDFTGGSSTIYVDDRTNPILDLSAVLNDQGNTFDGAVTVRGSSGNIVDDRIYGGIKKTVGAASSGQAVVVEPGTYSESVSIDTSNVALTAADGAAAPTIDGGSSDAVTITKQGVTVSGFTLKTDSIGVDIDADADAGTGIVVTQNNIVDVSSGINTDDGSGTVDAARNWWGDASGPSGDGPGTGSSITTGVDFRPFYTSTPLASPAPHIDVATTADTDNDGAVDEITVTLSKAIDDSDSTLSASEFTLDSGTVGSVDTGASPDDNTLILRGITGLDGTGVTPDITLAAGALEDSGGQTLGSDQTFTATGDGAAPVVLSVRKFADSQVNVFYSETIDSADSADYTYVDNNGGGATAFTSLTASSVGDNSQINLDGTDNPFISADINFDQVSFASGASITDGSGNNLVQGGSAVQIQNPSGFSLQGDSNNDISTAIGGSSTQTLRAGSTDQELNLIRVKDVSGGSSPLSARTILEMPDGVTINESATDVLATTTSGGLNITGTQIVDENTLRIEHSGSSVNGQPLRVSGISVDVAPNVSASQSGVASDITVKYATGALDTALVTVEKPQIQTDGSEAVNAGGTGQDLTDSIGDIRVQTGANVDGQIANDSEIVINANASNGITFDTDVDPTTLTASTTGNAEVDMSSATLTEDALTIPVTAHFDGGDYVDINTDAGDELLVDVAGDAENAKLSGTVVANGSTGDIALEQSTQTQDLSVQSTDINIASGSVQSLAVGLDQQVLSEGGVNVGGADTAIEVVDTTGGQMASDTNVTIRLNSSAVTFDTSQGSSVSAGGLPATDNEELDIGFSDASSTDADVSEVTIFEDRIEVSVDNGATTAGDALLIGDVGLNVSTTASDSADDAFEAVTRSGASAPDVTSTSTAVKNDGASPTSNQFVTLERPDYELASGDQAADPASSGNITFDVDGDGFTQQRVDANGDYGLVIGPTLDGQLADATNVTVSLEDDTGVTFDTQASASAGADSNDDTDIDVYSNDIGVDKVNIVDATTLEIELTDTGNTGPSEQYASGNRIVIDDFVVNATSSASPTNVSVTTNATVSSPDGSDVTGGGGTFTSTADNEVTTTLAAVLEPGTVEPNEIKIDPDRSSDDFPSFAYGADQQINSPEVTNTITSGVKVRDGGSGFGGATVTLEILSTPEGSSGAQLNTTQLTTDSNGEAEFNFTAGNTTGDYVVNATVDETGAGVNVTYTAQPGAVEGVTVTPIENAIAGDSSDLGVAALYVNSTDANGNKVTGSSPTVEITADNVGSSEVDSSNDFNNGKSTVAGISDGTFSLHSADGSSVVYVKSSQVENVTISAAISGESDTGTVTFYDQVGQVDLALNQSAVGVDDTVAAEATIRDTDGTTIEVPGVTVNYDDNNNDNNNDNTTFAGGANSDSATTNGAGVASVNVTAEQFGSSTIEAQSNLRADSATLTIAEETASVTFDDETVENGTEEVTVDSANYTLADGSAGDYVVVAHVVNDNGSISNPVGYSSNVTGDTSNITVDLNASEAQGDALDTLSENTTLRAMLHETSRDSAFGPSLGLATDDANITVQEEPAAEDLAPYTNDNGVVDASGLQDAAADFRSQSIDSEVLLDAAAAFRSSDPVTS